MVKFRKDAKVAIQFNRKAAESHRLDQFGKVKLFDGQQLSFVVVVR